jgi:hypothetical protein
MRPAYAPQCSCGRWCDDGFSQGCRQAGLQADMSLVMPSHKCLIFHQPVPLGVGLLVLWLQDFTELTRKYPQLMSKAMGSHNSILRKVSAAITINQFITLSW